MSLGSLRPSSYRQEVAKWTVTGNAPHTYRFTLALPVSMSFVFYFPLVNPLCSQCMLDTIVLVVVLVQYPTCENVAFVNHVRLHLQLQNSQVHECYFYSKCLCTEIILRLPQASSTEKSITNMKELLGF